MIGNIGIGTFDVASPDKDLSLYSGVSTSNLSSSLAELDEVRSKSWVYTRE